MALLVTGIPQLTIAAFSKKCHQTQHFLPDSNNLQREDGYMNIYLNSQEIVLMQIYTNWNYVSWGMPIPTASY
jgi:hypothetical protein